MKNTQLCPANTARGALLVATGRRSKRGGNTRRGLRKPSSTFPRCNAELLAAAVFLVASITLAQAATALGVANRAGCRERWREPQRACQDCVSERAPRCAGRPATHVVDPAFACPVTKVMPRHVFGVSRRRKYVGRLPQCRRASTMERSNRHGESGLEVCGCTLVGGCLTWDPWAVGRILAMYILLSTHIYYQVGIVIVVQYLPERVDR